MANETLSIGVIQTSLDANAAWVIGPAGWQSAIKMSLLEEKRAAKEIRHFLASLNSLERRPDIILLPELSVPMGYEAQLKDAAEKMGSIIIAGLDYQIERTSPAPMVSNEAVVIVPRRLNGVQIARHTELRRVGKTYGAPGELKKLNKIPVGFQPRPTVWIFDSESLGKFAVAICYDFADLDRIVLYRKQIQTLFIIAYNRDITSFDHIAEAIARTVFCNVVVCNCGFFGGSLAVSPFREPYKRTIYRHSGQKLANAQLIELPLSALIEHQNKDDTTEGEFKSLPAGYSNTIPHDTKTVSV